MWHTNNTNFFVLYEQGAAGSLDGIIDTVSAIHPLLPLINLLKTHGKLAMTGAPEKPLDLPVFPQLLGIFCLKSTIFVYSFSQSEILICDKWDEWASLLLDLCCADSSKMLTHTYQILQKYSTCRPSKMHLLMLLKCSRSIALDERAFCWKATLG